MDSVIAKLDNSVFGMLVDQQPHILICGINTEDDVDFINAVRPDFICMDKGADADLKKKVTPVVRVLDSPDDLPYISGADDARALKIDADTDPEKAVKTVRTVKPDTIVTALTGHGTDEYDKVRRLVRAVRSMHSEMVD